MIEVTGGSSPNQYRKKASLPFSSEREITAEVDIEAMDIIHIWELGFNLGNVQKAMCRLSKKATIDERYDFDKMLFFILREMYERNLVSHNEFWNKLKALELSE